MQQERSKPAPGRITLFQWLAVAALWAAIGYGVLAKPPSPRPYAGVDRLNSCR